MSITKRVNDIEGAFTPAKKYYVAHPANDEQTIFDVCESGKDETTSRRMTREELDQMDEDDIVIFVIHYKDTLPGEVLNAD